MTAVAPFKFPDEMLSQHLAILGKSGSGKTYTSKGMVERLLTGKRRVCILDPTGVWWGLRSSADGKRAGFPVVIFGGLHADVPISEASGNAVAKVIASNNLPAIIDLSEMLIGGRHQFSTDFAAEVYRLNRAPLHLVIDEADEFAPQNPMPETKRMLHHVDRIVRRGRVRGFRVMLITQRPAVLHKNVLTQANTLVAMRLTAPQDRDAMKAWIEGQADAVQGKIVMDSLPSLKTGDGWVWAPELGVLERATFPKITTFDSSRTPADDEVIEEPKKLAAVDLGEIKASFDAIAKEASTVRELRAELAELHRIANSASKSPVSKSTPGVSEAEVKRRIDEAIGALPKVATPIGRVSKKTLVAAVEKIAAGLQAIQAELAGVDVEIVPRARTIVRERAAPAAKAAPPSGAPEQRILDSIAWWCDAGIEHPSRHQVAFVANYTVNGHFNNLAGTLRGKGLIVYPSGGALCLTEQGWTVAKAPTSKPTRADLVERVTAVLKSEPLRRIFAVLVNTNRPMGRRDLAEAAGYTENGHFNNIVGSLNGIGVIEYPTKGFVGLSSIFKDME